MRLTFASILLISLSSCWPTSISFKDSNMPPEWQEFYVVTLDNKAANSPLSYSVDLSEAVKDGIQNRTKLNLANAADDAQIEIEGVITSYGVSPIAIEGNDQASQNRLTVSVKFTIFVKEPEEEEMTVTSTRFVDYDSNTDLATVESTLLEDVTTQIVQDVINKLQSNW